MTVKRRTQGAAALVAEAGTRDMRRHERLPLRAQVRYKIVQRRRIPEGGRPEGYRPDGQCVNISLRGLALETAQPLARGEYLKLEMRLPGRDQPIQALAEVVWTEPRGAGHAAGIRFLILLNQADDAMIRRFIEGADGGAKG